MDKFLETSSPPKLNQEEIDHWNRLITRSEIESVIIKNKQTKKTKNTSLQTRVQDHKASLGSSTKHTKKNLYQFFSNSPKRLKRQEHSQNILWSHHHPDIKTRHLSCSPAILAAPRGWGSSAPKAGRWWPQRRWKSHWSQSTLGSNSLWRVESTCWGRSRLWKWSDKAKQNWSSLPTTSQPWGIWNRVLCHVGQNWYPSLQWQ